MKLMLFDIDGTLLRSGGAGMLSLSRAFAERFGIDDSFSDIRPHGKTDPIILREILRTRALVDSTEEEDQAVAEITTRYEEIFAEVMPVANRAILLPGVVPLLEALTQRDDLLLGLLTGNFETTARIKLERFGLNRFFSFGAYSSDAEDRNRLVPIAVDRAESLTGLEIGLDRNVVVIGDTPRDVECALAHGVTPVGVATSDFSETCLREAGAYLTFADFTDTDAVVDSLLAIPRR
jgi:phosphoglycolate phosphatase-like HAD superfamily hydrolase